MSKLQSRFARNGSLRLRFGGEEFGKYVPGSGELWVMAGAVVALVYTRHDHACVVRTRYIHTRDAIANGAVVDGRLSLRERVSLGMQRAPIYGAARARAFARTVVERPFEGQGSRLSLSERRYIYATHGHYLYYLYRIAIDPDAVRLPCLPA